MAPKLLREYHHSLKNIKQSQLSDFGDFIGGIIYEHADSKSKKK